MARTGRPRGGSRGPGAHSGSGPAWLRQRRAWASSPTFDPGRPESIARVVGRDAWNAKRKAKMLQRRAMIARLYREGRPIAHLASRATITVDLRALGIRRRLLSISTRIEADARKLVAKVDRDRERAAAPKPKPRARA